MIDRFFNIFCTLILASLFLAEVLIALAKGIGSLDIPYWLYIASIYLRAVSSVACFFLGLYAVTAKMKFRYLLITVGVLFAFLSVAPPLTALYFSGGINTNYLNNTELQNFHDSIKLQKSILTFHIIVFITLSTAFWVAFKKRNITK
ncbi:hypothetical protein [Desulfuromonas sp. AOP6]|uniref:hypothetical protein n=1 Tax=Desulfuromonas sp. AOP6 TaxID=1566351 RepID=UPI0012DF6247|nr:hypothetical protein [Desulfuromonas sp. AOP6]